MNENWYALYTKSGCEKKVANLLSRKNIENYCPLKREWNGKKKVILEPLFQGYVFVKTKEQELTNIRMTECVINFVYWLGHPAIISNHEISIIKRFMNEYANVTLEKLPFEFEVRNNFNEDPLTQNRSRLVSLKNNIVKISLPSLGYNMVAEVEKSRLINKTSSVTLSFLEDY